MNQLTMFEPTGREVLQLAFSKEKEGERFLQRAELLTFRGWHRAAQGELRRAQEAFDDAEQMNMLAEFEALGGVTK